MSKTSIIMHPERSYYISIREDYLLLCQDAPDMHVAALILDRFEYWTNYKLDAHQDDFEQAWIYKSIENMQADLYHDCGRNKIIDGLHWLTDMGYLEKRTNPENNWDKTLQYRLNYPLVNLDLSIVWNGNIDSLELNPRKFRNKQAIPKKPVKDTIEDTSTEENAGAGVDDYKPIQEQDNSLGRLAQFYEANFGLLTSHIKDSLIDLLETSSEAHVKKAMEVAVESNKRSLAYVKGVLKRLIAEGIETPLEQKENPPPRLKRRLTNAQLNRGDNGTK